MNKTAIKNFAIWARNKLIADISYRAGLMGITTERIQKALPQSTGTTEFYDIGTAEPYSISGTEVKQREKLVELICRKEKETNYKTAYKYVLEEVAYTWFNRLIAVRFMEVNDYLPSHIRVLSSETGKTEPDLLTNPFGAELSFTAVEEQEIYRLKQENKSDDAFRLLFIKQYNALNEILPALFEKTSDYTELLLNLSIIDQDGVIWHLVHDIPEEDFDVKRGGQVEIIGWLYQYYNTEPKNEAFGKKGKISKEEIPAVTQLFTPNWIVQYMVENSVGRLWIEHLRAIDESADESDLAASFGWKYYLPEAKQEPEVETELRELRKERASLTPEQITTIDPCMGSGHILVYAFDVLIQIYESAGYGQRDAARSILENNLYGLDIDDRAFQLAYFAIMMKARQYNRRILNGEVKPNVYSIQESNGIDRNQLKFFGGGLNEMEKNIAITQMTGLLDTFMDAKEYGSILTVDSYDWELLNRFVSQGEMLGQMSMDTVGLEDTAEKLKQLIAQGKVLAQKYHVTITNPPYMSASNCSEKSSNLIKKNFPNSKTDLFAVFIERCNQYVCNSGYQAMITMHSWMFISSYENLRAIILKNEIVNMAHLGAHAFEEIGGEVVQTTSFVIRKESSNSYKGDYIRLTEEKSQDSKEHAYLGGNNRFVSGQDNFEKISGSPIAYWVPEQGYGAFGLKTLNDYVIASVGIQTGDNNKFVLLWWEPSYLEVNRDAKRAEDSFADSKWFPYNKGGEYRKWYGNDYYIINWQDNGHDIIHNSEVTGHHYQQYADNLKFKPLVTWSRVSTGTPAFRYKQNGYLCDMAGFSLYADSEELKVILGYCNSKVAGYYLKFLAPTLNIMVGSVLSMPYITDISERSHIISLVENAIQLAKDDWDQDETSWDFKKHPLIDENSKIKSSFNQWKLQCDERFMALQSCEENINDIFINAYGMDGVIESREKEENISICKPSLRVIKTLLSYAVGCMFGRYSLDTVGLAYAGGTWDARKYEKFKPDGDNVIPLTDEEYLEDDIISRLCEFLKVVYDEQALEENLDFIAKALGNKGDSSREIIRNYFLNDFFKDHCQTYSVTGSGKRPIYWLFDSGKNNGFKALIYLHRYNADTIGNLRIDYLHRMQRIYESEMSRMQDMIDHSTNAREVVQATKRREKLTKQLKECCEYDEKLAHLALSRIELDLDDGVKKNYRKIQTANDEKFYEVLADSKNIMSKE